jgi:hypothetical protein
MQDLNFELFTSAVWRFEFIWRLPYNAAVKAKHPPAPFKGGIESES